MPSRQFSLPMLGSLLLAAMLAGAPAEQSAGGASTQQPLPYPRIVLRSGTVIDIGGGFRVEGEKVLFRSPTGVLYSIAIDEVDFESMARPKISDDPVEKHDVSARHPVKKLNVTPEERDRLLAELSKKTSTPRTDVEVLSPNLPRVSEAGAAVREANKGAEERWRAEARAAREAVESREAELRTLKQRAVQLEDQLRMLLSSGYDPNTLSAQANELDSTRNRIESAEDAVRDARQNLAELEDRARRAGIMPGWLRD